MEPVPDVVVLLDEDARPIGTAPRAEVHDARTPLHLAFSCYLFDRSGRLLLTRRAITKRTWPGVWTNSFCGHPRPSEPMVEAIERYGRHELGVDVSDIRPALPDFRYRAVDASGVVENEVCPVFVARCTDDADDIAANPDEVAEWRWVTAEELRAAVDAAPWALSPWLLEQHEQLSRLEDWPAGVR
ncbi:MAG TPA: isopentenyl-diphosphate Delta-isomerase [Nocardioides sp.]|nr:isopentenyl-diphosphate Delta-isomerase [Nocardioides sp.]